MAHIRVHSLEEFSIIMLDGCTSLLSARSSFVWTEWKLDSQNSHAVQGEFQLPLTCPGSDLCWVYLLSNLKMGAETRRACQLAIKTQGKHHKTCLALQPLAEKSLVCGLIGRQPLLWKDLDGTWLVVTQETQPCAFTSVVLCCFVFLQDVHSEVVFTLWRTRGTQIWENPSASCTASSATANL